ncbi:hypothetical protein I4U23_013821 [Adineta vaga]|nr:hypothetical protein I4U23_013821 [Adineta vaga]
MDEFNDECYKQILCFNESVYHEKESIFKINPLDRFHLYVLLVLILTSQSNALPIHQKKYENPASYPIAMVHFIDRSTPVMYSQLNSYKIYRRIPLLSSSNNNAYSPTNSNHQQELKRERYRRTMIDRLFTFFDEDVNGQLSKDELYSLSLRLNIFPKFHRFLKQTSTGK